MARKDGVPPRPYEAALERLLTAAIRTERDDDRIEVKVEGRAAYVFDPDRDVWERSLVTEETITFGIALAAGLVESADSDVSLLSWDDEVGNQLVDDGRSWLADDGMGGHWCLDPSSCNDLRRRLEE